MQWRVSVQQGVPVKSTQPAVTGVTFSGSGASTMMVIRGAGFGIAPTQVPLTGDIDFFSLQDTSNNGSNTFTAGGNYFSATAADGITLNYQSWDDNEIVISGFGGNYGSNGDVILPGDSVALTIWNSSDVNSSGPVTTWTGTVPTPVLTSPAPQQPVRMSSLPTEAGLWNPQPTLENNLLSDPSIQQYLQKSQSTTDIESANAFLANPPTNGWKHFFTNAQSVADNLGTAAGFAGDLADPTTPAAEYALDGGRAELEQVPLFKNNAIFQVIDQNFGLVADTVSLVKDCGSAVGTIGGDVPDDGSCFLSAVGFAASDLLSQGLRI